MNRIIKNLTIQNFNDLKNSFVNSKKIFWNEQEKKLIHPGEYGIYREDLVKKWLQFYVPEKFGISSGFIIDSSGYISTQCDIIIYDKATTPKIENMVNQRFFPIETVCCVGEIKSDIKTMGEFSSFLKKLSEIKKIRENVKDPEPYFRGNFKAVFSPHENPFDNVFTFIICNKFNFNIQSKKINYGNIDQRLKHNLVLSLHDGILAYKVNQVEKELLSFPFMGDNIHTDCFLKNDSDELPLSVVSFLSSLQMALNNNALLSIDMTRYILEDEKISEKIIF